MGGKSTHGRAALIAVLTALGLMGFVRPAWLDALELNVSASEIERALRLARSPSDVDRARFHRRYRFPADGRSGETVFLESVEVVTEFRRMELIGEEHARINDTFGRAGLADAEAALAPWRGLVTVVAHVGIVGAGRMFDVPPIDIALDALTPVGPARRTGRSSGKTLIGGRIEQAFPAAAIGQATRRVVVSWNGKTLGGARVDFRAID